MSHSPEKTPQRQTDNAIVSSLYVMAFVVGLTSLVAVLFQLSVAFSRKNPPVQADEIIYTIALGVGGIAMGLLLGAIGAAVSYLQVQTHMMHRLVRSQEDAAAFLSRLCANKEPGMLVVPPAPIEVATAQQITWQESQRMEQILETVVEISENVLLTPEQRQAKRSRLLQDTQRNLSDMLSKLLATGNFVEAQARMDQYVRLFPEDKAAAEDFQQRIDDAREQVLDNEYNLGAAKVRDLMSTASWDRADEVAQSLLKRHPKSQEVRELVDSVHREKIKFQQQHRQHLLAQIESLSVQRHWQEAYRLATDMISRFGDSPEGQIIKDKLDTLRDNAEIEIRKHFEDQYKELYRSHRYIEALALAQDVIGKYPNSPQAKALREQLPQLMNKAKLQMDQGGRMGSSA